MASVDDRVVAMKFDNSAFESKVAATMASLDKLKASLDFSKSRRGMDDIALSSRSFNLDNMANAIEGISSKFTAMGAIAFTVLQNIVNRAVDAGISLGKSLSLDQVIGGFQEYETNLNSIQTVLANTKSKGTDLEDVNAALDQLNTYSDQTIYNFSQMARNIGTFTAAGVDLDTSVQGIKGIANLAAISGSNAEQASTAMYQLSQALASGSVKLMDWNSVVNAGMGGEVFQKALFQTGQALGTIKDVPIGQTFDEWKDAGNTFRASLESGWITADVLTNTLSTFTGDLTEAQVRALGYTEEQVAGIVEMGKTGKDAATKVKTLTQLISTVKESIGSGWSASFRTIFGDFEQARNTFTTFSEAISGVVSKNADARNALLTAWAQMGGRTVLITGITNAFQALGGILAPIKAAFSDIFPPVTATRLLELTRAFRNFMEDLKPTPAVAVLLTRTFRGVFSIFSIGIEVIKGVAHFFGDLFDMFNKSNDPNSGILGFTARIGDGIFKLRQALVNGGGIATFFEGLGEKVKAFLDGLTFDNAIEKFKGLGGRIKAALFEAFEKFQPGKIEIVSGLLDRVAERFGWITDLGQTFVKVWHAIGNVFDFVKDKASAFIGFVKEAFSGFGQAVSDAISDTDYDTALDTINTGLFAGIVLLIKQFMSNGFKGFGDGVFQSVSQAFNELTGTLQAMQSNIKADTLMKIAIAVGVLTASILILSLVNSAALTKSMAAIAVGFGQLVTAMALLNTVVTGPKDALKLSLLAGGLILLAGAMTLLAVAATIFAALSWEEIAKGLVAISALLVALSLAVEPISENSSGMVRAGLGIIAISVALNILALATKSFAEMNWEEMAQGLIAVGAGLLIITQAMQQIPTHILLDSLGIIAMATALNILALAVKSFAQLNWEEMGRGLAGVAGTLVVLTVALRKMPKGPSLALQGVGLALIGVGLIAISQAIKNLGGMSWKEMAKGLTGLAGALVVLAFGMAGMEEGIPGAIAVAITSVALKKLAEAVKAFAAISWGDLLHGLGALAATMGVLAISALLIEPAIVPLLAFGAALILIGAGFALFGIGAAGVATAFGVLATAGTEGIATLVAAMDALITHLPAIIAAFGDGILQLAQKIIEALPAMIAGLDDIIVALLQLLIDSIPKMAEAFKTLVMAGLGALVDLAPDVIAAGLALLLDLLHGIEDNIEEITTTVMSIITKFLESVGAHTQELVTAGLGILTEFLNGIANNLEDVITAAGNIIVKFIEGIGRDAIDIVNAGGDMIVKIIRGITQMANDIVTAGADAIISFVKGISDNTIKVVNAGFDIIIDFINGIAESIRTHSKELRDAGWNLATAIAEGMTGGLSAKAGSIKDAIINTIGGPIKFLNDIWHVNSPSKITMQLASDIAEGFVKGLDDDTTIGSSVRRFGNNAVGLLQKTLSAIPAAIAVMDEFNPTITPVLDLTQVRAQASAMNGILGSAPNLEGTVSYSQANDISSRTIESSQDTTVTDPKSNVTEVKFEQTINSPTPLSTAEIYRQTRNQIALAKEELAVA